jgi:hypothetical protein
MTRTMRAWRRANACVRDGNHANAVYWLTRTQAILDGARPRRKHSDGMDTGYLITAVVVMLAFWIVMGDRRQF